VTFKFERKNEKAYYMDHFLRPFFYDATASSGQGPPHYQGFLITQTHYTR